MGTLAQSRSIDQPNEAAWLLILHYITFSLANKLTGIKYNDQSKSPLYHCAFPLMKTINIQF